MRLLRIPRKGTKMLAFMLALLFVVLFKVYPKYDAGTLIQAHIIFRHGNRTPIATFPTDPHKEYGWKNGFGELTDVGKASSFLFGSALREHYIVSKQLIPPEYDRKKFFIISTESDRTLETAALVLAGLFPLQETRVYPVEPIPIRFLKTSSDYLLKTRSENCPKLKKPIEAMAKSSEFVKEQKRYKNFFNLLSSLTGWEVNFKNINKVYQALSIEKSYKMTLPEWATEDVLRQIEEVYKLKVKTFTKVDDITYRRLVGGTLLHNITSSMRKAVSGQAAPSMFLYSAHDTTIGKVFAALQIAEYEPVPFNAALAFELYLIKNKCFLRC